MQGRERWSGWEEWDGEAQEEDAADRGEHCKPPGAVKQQGSLRGSICDGAWGEAGLKSWPASYMEGHCTPGCCLFPVSEEEAQCLCT